MPPTKPPTKELRLGLVCYGGVSLAIYMHGIAKEIHKLTVASRAYDGDPGGANPFADGSVEAVYWDALRTAHQDQGVQTQVVVDVIAGTSAGGINGVFLAKVLAHNGSQESLTRMWFDKGDIRELLAGGRLKRAWKVTRLGLGLLVPKLKARPPLRGNEMLKWLYTALGEIDGSERPAALPDRDHLLVEGQELDLFVTTTDFYGYTRQIPIADPPAVDEKRHRHVFHFRASDKSKGQFAEEHNAALALACRCTSSFPGAFPPVSLGDLQTLEGVDEDRVEKIKGEYFREYGLSAEDAGVTHFVDGGVIDNKPFGHTLDAIVRKGARGEVDRKLIYIEPDPSYRPPEPGGQEPSLLKTAWGGLSSIAGFEPIVDDILAVEVLNRRVRRINEIVNGCSDDVLALLKDEKVNAFEVDATKEAIAELRRKIHEAAEEKFGTAQKAYFLLKVHSVVDQFAEVVCVWQEFPLASNPANLVRQIVLTWACERRLLGAKADPEEQKTLLQHFDLGYTRRRIQFVIQGINGLYSQLPTPPDPEKHPTRQELDEAKQALAGEYETMVGLIAGDRMPPAVKARVAGLFSGFTFDFKRQSITSLAADFVANHGDKLDSLRAELGPHLDNERDQVRAKLFGEFRKITAPWPAEIREGILSRYLGFPFWDSLIYPIQALGQAGELDEIQVVRLSPEEATLLEPEGLAEKGRTAAKLEGVQKGHFGAFFKRSARQNDYLWGRLDAAERLLALLQPDGARRAKSAFEAILAEEEKNLETITDRIRTLKSEVAKLP